MGGGQIQLLLLGYMGGLGWVGLKITGPNAALWPLLPRSLGWVGGCDSGDELMDGSLPPLCFVYSRYVLILNVFTYYILYHYYMLQNKQQY